MSISYTVKPGDCALSVAVAHGIPWEKVWNNPANDAIQNLRKVPNILREGDVLVIPLETKAVMLATGMVHKIVIQREMLTLRLRLHTVRGEPRRNLSFTVRHNGKTLATGISDDEGVCEAKIPADAHTVDLVVAGRFGDEVNEIRVGYLDPLDLDGGVQHRLNNLGYPTTLGDTWDEFSKDSLRRFQGRNGLDESGIVDAPTRQKIAELHGS